MNIVLVHPAGSNWVPGQTDFTPIANRMAPLGLLSMAAWLRERHHRVQVYDCLAWDRPRPQPAVVRDILDRQPDLVGFSATTSGFLDGYGLAETIKQQRPEIKTVFGGVHVSAIGTPLLKAFPAIDFLCMGEGEATLAELADGAPPADITGLIWRDDGRVVTNPRRPLLPDLDQMPFPAYDLLWGFPRRYHLPLFSYIQRPGATMVTSRGCPYKCSYCDRSVFKQGYRYNSAAYIYAHMRYLRNRFGVRHLNIYDDLFTAHRRRITRVLEGAILGSMFFEPSTRTRVSFGSAFNLLGGEVRETTGFEQSAIAKGESLYDTARVLSGYSDVIVMRHPAEGSVAEFAAASRVPILNMQCDVYHPCQILADLLTIREKHGTTRGLKMGVAWTSAPNYVRPLSVPQSLILLMPRFGIDVTLACPPEFRLKWFARCCATRV